MTINKYMLDIYIYIFNPWKVFCDLRFPEVYKTTFIRHLRRRFCFINFRKPKVVEYFPWIIYIYTKRNYKRYTDIRQNKVIIIKGIIPAATAITIWRYFYYCLLWIVTVRKYIFSFLKLLKLASCPKKKNWNLAILIFISEFAMHSADLH